MRKTFLILTVSAALLSGCAWETYQDGNGKTAVPNAAPCCPTKPATTPTKSIANTGKNQSFKTDKPTLCRLKPLQTAWHRKTLCRKTL